MHGDLYALHLYSVLFTSYVAKNGVRKGKHNTAAVCHASFSFFSPGSEQSVLLTPTGLPEES